MKKVLVTGGAGFVGSHTVEKLLQQGFQVRILDNLRNATLDNLGENRAHVDFVEGDVCDGETCKKALEGCEAVLHLAGVVSVPFSIQNPRLDQAVNLEASLRLLHLARCSGVSRFVFASSASVYGNIKAPVHLESNKLFPMSPYASAKAAVEQYLCSYAQVYGMSCMALRYFNIYGPRQNPGSPYSGVISLFIDAIRNQKQIRIYGDGTQTRDFIYVKDIAKANMLALKHEELSGYHVMNVGTGTARNLLELLEQLKSNMGVSKEPEFFLPRPGDIKHSCADVSCAESLLGFKADYSLKQGLSDWLHE